MQYHHVMTPKLNLNPVAIYKSSSQGELQMCVEAACIKKNYDNNEKLSRSCKVNTYLINVTVSCRTRRGLKISLLVVQDK